MERFDVFRSEGGWRVALSVVGENPVMDNSPWFETERAAKAFSAKKYRESDAESDQWARDHFPGKTPEQVWVMLADEDMAMA